MVARRVLYCLTILVLVGGGFVGQAMSQDGRPSAEEIAERLRARGIEVSPEQIEQGRKIMDDFRNCKEVDPERIQKMVSNIRKQVQLRAQTRIKELLGATDEEWQVLGPKVQKVQDLMLQTNTGQMGFARFRRGGMNLRAATGQSDVQKKFQALQELMKDKDASVAAITTALKAYRQARTKAKAELAKARKDLRELLTIRQEAQLVDLELLE